MDRSHPGATGGRAPDQRRAGKVDSAAVVETMIAERPRPSVVAGLLYASTVYVGFGFGMLAYLAFAWSWLPPAEIFLVVFDVAFVVCALAGIGYRAEADEDDPLGDLAGSRVWLTVGGGFWQVAKSLVRWFLFVVPSSAFEAVRSAFPPIGATSDREAIQVVVRIAGLKGSVPVRLFRYLNNEIAPRSFLRGVELAGYLGVVTVEGTTGRTKIVPTATHGTLAVRLTER